MRNNPHFTDGNPPFRFLPTPLGLQKCLSLFVQDFIQKILLGGKLHVEKLFGVESASLYLVIIIIVLN